MCCAVPVCWRPPQGLDELRQLESLAKHPCVQILLTNEIRNFARVDVLRQQNLLTHDCSTAPCYMLLLPPASAGSSSSCTTATPRHAPSWSSSPSAAFFRRGRRHSSASSPLHRRRWSRFRYHVKFSGRVQSTLLYTHLTGIISIYVHV